MVYLALELAEASEVILTEAVVSVAADTQVDTEWAAVLISVVVSECLAVDSAAEWVTLAAVLAEGWLVLELLAQVAVDSAEIWAADLVTQVEASAVELTSVVVLVDQE